MHAWLADLTPPTAAERLADYYRRAIAAGAWQPLEAHARGQLAVRHLRRWCGTAMPADQDDDELSPWLGERYLDLLHDMHRRLFPAYPYPTPQEPDHERPR
ncbi:hypothetical protein LJB71_13085 [Thermomonas sp. S9]|uniref:hypothetical protein n=1 Tax=Thermomonas sp. S9 TaxID=2885203 RepID=UPI00216AB490|nr:hypothetical protein [Thermomonas sp. S9]MCR6494814.1 hypothetical protein [Thermomonas sp. S9]MCR6497062.1 hypothetical protein [Thermomonas sp. S9]